MVAIQRNLDGSFPGLDLKQIFAIEPAAKILFAKCVAYGIENPLKDAARFFERNIKPAMQRLVGWESQKPELSAPETYEVLHRALHDAANCFVFYNKHRNTKWIHRAFKDKYGILPRFDVRKTGVMS
jgi:hypothetical protein